MNCKEIWNKKNEEPPCDTCVEPLFEENVDAIRVYFLIQNQLIIAEGKIIDLNFCAVKDAMDMFQILDQKKCYEKVRILFDFFKQTGEK